MNLELCIEEETAGAVINQLVTGLPQLIPKVEKVSVTRYSLALDSVLSEDELKVVLGSQIDELFATSPLREDDIVVPEVDAIVVARRTGQQRYFNGPKKMLSLASQRNGDGFMLMLTHHPFFSVGYYPSTDTKSRQRVLDVTTYEMLNEGIWYSSQKAAIITSANYPTHGNLRVAAHELGHGFGLAHHEGDCIMQVKFSFLLLPKTFCGSCLDTIMTREAK